MPAKLLAFLWFGSTGGFCGTYEDSGCGTGVPVYHPYIPTVNATTLMSSTFSSCCGDTRLVSYKLSAYTFLLFSNASSMSVYT